MSVDLNAVRRIAHLARIEVSEAETPHLQGEINAILKFVEALDAVDVEGVEPMTSVIPMRLPMREDVVTDGEIARARARQCAPDRGRLLSRSQSDRVTGSSGTRVFKDWI